jgi:hypothetical protein
MHIPRQHQGAQIQLSGPRVLSRGWCRQVPRLIDRQSPLGHRPSAGPWHAAEKKAVYSAIRRRYPGLAARWSVIPTRGGSGRRFGQAEARTTAESLQMSRMGQMQQVTASSAFCCKWLRT